MLKITFLFLSILLSIGMLVNSFVCQKFLKMHSKSEIGQELQMQEETFYQLLSGLVLLGYLNFIISRMADYFNTCQVFLCFGRICQFLQFSCYTMVLLIQYIVLFDSASVNQAYQTLRDDLSSENNYGSKESQEQQKTYKSEEDYVFFQAIMIQVIRVTFLGIIILGPLSFLVLYRYHKQLFKSGSFYSSSAQISETSYVNQIDEGIEIADKPDSSRTSAGRNTIKSLK